MVKNLKVIQWFYLHVAVVERLETFNLKDKKVILIEPINSPKLYNFDKKTRVLKIEPKDNNYSFSLKYQWCTVSILLQD